MSLFFFAQLLQTVLGYGPLDVGLRLIPWTATFIMPLVVAGVGVSMAIPSAQNSVVGSVRDEGSARRLGPTA